jgi:L-threonylcarbamoyladenylate synthase
MQTMIGVDIETAATYLRKEELVAIPTETVYGLAGNALSETAVIRIYEAKNRPRFNPLILHVPDLASIEKYAVVDPVSRQLAEAFMPGPFTLLLPKKEIVPEMVTAGSDKVAIRIPDHALTRTLLRTVGFPLAAPSANPFGYVSPTTAEHVLQGLNGKIPYILDGGPSQVGVESSIAEVSGNEVILHRAGGVTAEMIRSVTGMPVVENTHSTSPSTPGQLKSHYATHIPLYKGNMRELIEQFKDQKMAVISFTRSYPVSAGSSLFVLSPAGDINEAARQLFDTMRRIDSMDIDVILAEDFPDQGIGRAINDRLNRAQVVFK